MATTARDLSEMAPADLGVLMQQLRFRSAIVKRCRVAARDRMMCAPDDPVQTSFSRASFLIKLTCDMTALDVGLRRGIPIRESSYV
jgi:hypothetical protein